jgi:MerR family transcriptional regulator/heat shock protein HspR
MAVNPDEPVYVISVAARMLRVHPQTLRMYERVGLVHPQRSQANIRLYSEGDLERLRHIQRLTRELGVNLAGVEIILDLLGKMEALQRRVQAEMRRQRREIERELREELLGEER